MANPLIEQDEEAEGADAQAAGGEGAAPQSKYGNEEYQEGVNDPEVDIDPEDLQLLLFQRVRQLSPQESQAFAQVVNPQTLPVFMKLFPELGPLFQKIMEHKSGGAPQGGAAPQPMPQGGAPAQPQAQAMPSDPNLSRGLMG